MAEQDRAACGERRAVMPALASRRQTTKVRLALVPQYLSGVGLYESSDYSLSCHDQRVTLSPAPSGPRALTCASAPRQAGKKDRSGRLRATAAQSADCWRPGRDELSTAVRDVTTGDAKIPAGGHVPGE